MFICLYVCKCMLCECIFVCLFVVMYIGTKLLMWMPCLFFIQLYNPISAAKSVALYTNDFQDIQSYNFLWSPILICLQQGIWQGHIQFTRSCIFIYHNFYSENVCYQFYFWYSRPHNTWIQRYLLVFWIWP